MNRDEIKAVYDLGPEAIIDLVQRLFALISEQQQQIALLTARVKELEDRLAQDSHNSSQPPASDTFKQKTTSLRQPSTKKSGGQPGHPGTTLKLVPVPDRVIRHAPHQCTGCGALLQEVTGTLTAERRQVFDIPPLKLEVAEHRVAITDCPWCGQRNVGDFPAQVLAGTQYGAGIKAVALYLRAQHLLPWRRTCEILAELFDQPISEATLSAALSLCETSLVDIEAMIKQAVARAALAHFDETGIYVDGSRQWLHVASTPELTHYAPHAKRGAEATREIGRLPHFTGRAVHDGWRAYLKYDCPHSLCNAHHLRELTFLEEQLGHAWAGQMKQLLVEIKTAVDAARRHGHSRLDQVSSAGYEARYQAILDEGFAVEEATVPLPTGKRGRKKQSKAKNLLDRLHRYGPEVLAFMKDFAVPFDNNLAERDLRMMKVQQKISGCFRTTEGATAFCRIRSYISTLRKQGHNVLSALRSVFSGTPLVPDVPG